MCASIESRAGERFFSPGRMIWKVDREMVLLLAGGRALLMQLAHPKVAAGVAEHSPFKDDPLGRLHSTISTIQSLAFADPPKTQAAPALITNINSNIGCA